MSTTKLLRLDFTEYFFLQSTAFLSTFILLRSLKDRSNLMTHYVSYCLKNQLYKLLVGLNTKMSILITQIRYKKISLPILEQLESLT